MRRLAGSWISSDDRCAASATTTKEGTTGKCYPSPEYNLLPITWTVQTLPPPGWNELRRRRRVVLRGATRWQRPALLSQESFREIQTLLYLTQLVTDLLKLRG